jgi:hypothetical protein
MTDDGKFAMVEPGKTMIDFPDPRHLKPPIVYRQNEMPKYNLEFQHHKDGAT